MACELHITSVTANGTPGQPVSSIAVSGTAVDCDSVVVQISCGGGQKTNTESVSLGQWQTVFSDVAGTGCVCGDPNVSLRVVVFCKADPSCLDTRTLHPIPCYAACPTINHIDVVVPTCAEVLAAGRYDVTFRAYIDGVGVTQCFWIFGDGENNPVVAGTLPVGGVATTTHSYACPGEYTVTLLILSDCQPGYSDSGAKTFTLPSCGCPAVNSFNATSEPGHPCRWTFEVKIGGPFAPCVEGYLWNFGDGTTDQTGPGEPGVQHMYTDDGTYQVTVTMLGVGNADGGPCSYAHEITVNNCHDGGGGGGNGHSPCPWWNPFCKGWSLCGLILLLALAAILSAAGLSIFAACSGNPVAIAAAAATAAAGLVLLLFWVGLCHKVKPEFCNAINSLIAIISAILAAQPVILLLLWLLGMPASCFIGVLANFAYYGSLLVYLLYIRDWAECPH